MLPNFRGKYIHQQDIQWQKCRNVTFQLWAPLLETDTKQIRAQIQWLNAYLAEVCPDHPGWFLTPDQPR
jgi:hypothetical protein